MPVSEDARVVADDDEWQHKAHHISNPVTQDEANKAFTKLCQLQSESSLTSGFVFSQVGNDA